MFNLKLTNSNPGQYSPEPEQGSYGAGQAAPADSIFRHWQVARYLFFLRKHWWIVALSAIAFFGLGVMVNRVLPRSYSSTASLWMPGAVKVADAATYEDRGESQSMGATYAELITSDLIQNRAFDSLRSNGCAIPTNALGKPIPDKLKIIQVARAPVLQITAKGPTPAYTQDYLNAAMDAVIAYVGEVHEEQSTVTYATLNSQIALKEAELKTAQDNLTAYMRTNNVPVLEDRAKAASAYLSDLLTDYSKLSLEYQLLKAACATNSGDGSLNVAAMANTTTGTGTTGGATQDSDSASAAPAASFSEAQRELAKLKFMRESFAKYFKPAHPKMVKLDQEIAQLDGVCNSLRNLNREQLQAHMNMVKLKMDAIEKSTKDWEAKVNDASERIAEFERVKLDVERMRTFYDHLVTMMQNVDVSRNLPRYNANILDRASPPKPAKLPGSIIVAVACFAGLCFGLVVVRVVEAVSDKVTSADYLAYHFGERIVGHIPEAVGWGNGAATTPLELPDGGPLIAESYRSVRSALLFGGQNAEVPRVVLVTSAVPKEGKSTVASNLAKTIALGGSRVLLVDADMRQGTIHKLFGIPQSPGLADILAQDDEIGSMDGKFDFFARPTAIRGLFVLPCGQADTCVGDLLLRPTLDRLLQNARRAYDYVIVDSAPILAVDDTANLAPKTDGAIFVMRDSFTSAAAASRALKSLYGRQGNILGIVFNRVNGSSTYTYKGYADYYGQTKTLALKDRVA
jgi:capsular exopolysaccharide synthesis family protein